jgi:hypothetical protein
VQTSAREMPGVASDRGELGGVGLLAVDVGVRSLLIGEARQRAVTRLFGVSARDQSLLVTMILMGAVGTALRGLAPRPPSPSGADAAIGGALVNATLRGVAGVPSRTVPLAGALIAVGVLSHSLRPAVVGSAREVQALAHHVRAAFGSRYGR